MTNLKKMNTGISLTPSDFEFYQTFSQSDFNDMNNQLFCNSIFTGHYLCQEFNAFFVNLWVQHFKTTIV